MSLTKHEVLTLSEAKGEARMLSGTRLYRAFAGQSPLPGPRRRAM